MNIRTAALLGAMAFGSLFSAQAAQAVTIHDDNISSPYTGVYRPTGTSLSVNFNGGSGGPETLSFDLIGGKSLDGVNCCTDTFSLFLNSSLIFSGSFNLGGGGTNQVFFDSIGALFTGLNPNPAYTGPIGGMIGIAGLINLLPGTNNLTFSYSGAFQGTGDESWGINNATVSAVPLPPAALLLMSGIAGLAALRRRQKKAKA